MPDSSVRTRFAPSPTGSLHLGGARTALYNWLYARHCGGQFLLRLEDTDRERSREEHSQQIQSALRWMGLDWDGDVVRQSERAGRYEEVIQALVDDGHAYYCNCSTERLDRLRQEQMAAKIKPRYDRHCRDRGNPPSPQSVVRFKTPMEGSIMVRDGLKGEVEFANDELDDLVIARADGSATYHLAVVVDDLDAGITHILRGDDHFNNTPRQMHLFMALGAKTLDYTHLPMILDEQGKKLSKRKDAADVMEYRRQGHLPVTLVNALARLGWAHGDYDLFGRDELIEKFSLAGLNPAASRIDSQKIAWITQQQMKRVAESELAAEFQWHLAQQSWAACGLRKDLSLDALLRVQRQRCKNMRYLVEQSRAFLLEDVSLDAADKQKILTPEAQAWLAELAGELSEITWSAESVDATVRAVSKRCGVKLGKIAQPLRLAVTGGTVSPGIGDTLALLGKERALARLAAAIEAP